MIVPGGMKGKEVAVVGLARSGLAAARALDAAGAKVLAWDDSEKSRANATAQGIALTDLNAHDWNKVDALVLAPGIPLTHPKPHPLVDKARAAGVEVIGDIELLARSDLSSRFLGITGTNGKSTTTALAGHLLKVAGYEVAVGGNLGIPVLDLAPLSGDGVYVLELSSYQLDLITTLTLDVAILLNITPDHLDRHGGMKGYVAAKRRIFERQGAREVAVIGVDDPQSAAIFTELSAKPERRVVPVSVERAVAGGVYVLDGTLYDDIDGRAAMVGDLKPIRRLPGPHNWQNAAAAYAACRALGVPAETIMAGFRTFPGLPHRQRLIAVIDGVSYINDSKATNADAAAKALACYEHIYWIAGGRPKEGGLAGLEPYYPRIAEAFLIGEAEEAFAETLRPHVKVRRCGDLATAFKAASEAAKQDKSGEAVVLLAPACASFDQFPDFEARGAAFGALVEALPGERETLEGAA